jgi:hypothetical protein
MVCRRAIPHRSRVVRDELPLDRRPQIRPALRADQHDLRLAGRRHWSRPRHRPNSDAQGTGLFQRAKRRFVATDVAQCAAADGQDTCLLPGDPAGRDLGAGVARGGRYRCRARRSAGSPLTGRAVLVLLLSRTRRPGCRCGLRLGWFPPPVAHIRRGHRGGKAPSAFNLANKPLTNDQEAGPDDSKPASDLRFLVGDTGLEPVTSSVSGKRASQTAPIALAVLLSRWRRDLNPCGRLCRPLPRLSATPPSEAEQTSWASSSGRRDSNPRPSPWQGDALPTEPRPRDNGRSELPRCAEVDHSPSLRTPSKQ